MTAMYFIHELVEHSYEFPNILNAVEFVVIPVANPDGYAFTFSSSGDRLWNKNRRFNPSNPACPGVDVNANFNHAFQARPGDVRNFYFFKKCFMYATNFF
jgi:extracellular matrix protein 14